MLTPEASQVAVAGRPLLRLSLAALTLSHMVPSVLKAPSRRFLLPPVKLAAGGFN